MARKGGVKTEMAGGRRDKRMLRKDGIGEKRRHDGRKTWREKERGRKGGRLK